MQQTWQSFSYAKKKRHSDDDKFMKLDEMNKSTKITEEIFVLSSQFRKGKMITISLNLQTNVPSVFRDLKFTLKMFWYKQSNKIQIQR